jgi:general secretion pathway protein E
MSDGLSNVSERARQSAHRRRIDAGAQTKRAELPESTEPVPTDSGGPTSECSLESEADSLGIPFWENPQNHDVSREFVERIPVGFARQHAVLAFHADDAEDESTDVAIGSMESWPKLDIVGRILRRPVRPVLAPEDRILTAINAAYQEQQGQAASAVQVLDENDVATDLADLAAPEDLLDGTGKPPVIRLVNSILFEAVKARASDVHVQPQDGKLIVRQRIDGVLFDTIEIPAGHQEEVISRFKILGKMNIAEKRLPQDGRATVQFGDRLVDLRIASLPTSYGERVVVRFLDKHSRLYSLDELGMADENLRQLRSLIRRDHGMLLATGPTGSGKSTSLYAALQEIDSKDLNVLTLEDQIEYQLDGISQTQVNQKKGLTFAQGLRHVLRQDPDIIMVGEIRDHETAVMAIQSALTGHLVFSTLAHLVQG